MAEFLEKIPPEKRWAITAKVLTGFYVMIALKANELVLGKGEGVIAPISGLEMRKDISVKVLTLAAKRFYPRVKETFKIPVEDAIGGFKLVWVAGTLLGGPEWEDEVVEKTPERVVQRITKCPWWNRYKENEVKPEFTVCAAVDQVMVDEGLKAINPKITCKLAKALPRGDPYCEFIYEFKKE